MEKYSIDGRVIPTINGGKGSGNFGHSGRLGKVGGSGKSSHRSPKGEDSGLGHREREEEEYQEKAFRALGITDPSTLSEDDWDRVEMKKGELRDSAGEKDGFAIEYIHDDPRGKYGDGFDILEDAKEHLVDKSGEWEELSVYEDDARDTLGFPSRIEEAEGEEMSMSDIAEIQNYMAETIRDKSWDDLVRDLGQTTAESALDFGLDKEGYKFASENTKLGQAGLSGEDAIRDLKSFIVDFGIRDNYGAVKAAEQGDLRTAWSNISYDMRDKLRDEYGYDPLR